MKRIVICVMLMLFFVLNVGHCDLAYANEFDVEKKIEEQTHNQIKELDLEDLKNCYKDLNLDIAENLSATEVIQNIVDGKFSLSFGQMVHSVFNSIAVSFRKILPFIGVMLGIILLASMINRIKSQKFESGVSEIVFFSSYLVLLLIVSGLVVSKISEINDAICKMKSQMNAVFPILLVLMTCSGATTSVKMYQPAVAALAGGVSSVFSYILLPLISVMFVVCVVSNLSDNVKLNRFQDFLSSAFKWIIGSVSAIFMAFLAVKGISSATYDGVSIRTAKYAIKNYIPIIGGYISEGFELVIASSIILKNGIGVFAIIMLLSTVLAPIASIAVLSLSLKLVSAVSEPVSDKKFAGFLSSVSKTLSMLCVVLIVVALMYFLSLALIVSTANGLV